MTPYFDRVTIIGVGLLGASLGLALKAQKLAGHVMGAGRRQTSLDKALAAGAVDEVSIDAKRAVEGAGLVVIATPATAVIEKLDEIRDVVAPDAVVTDVASTKAAICAHAEATWPRPRRFVGSHPMAGSEKFGPEHGRPDFYVGSVCLVEHGPGLDPHAHDTVAALWRAVGAEVLEIRPDSHDAALARTSHTPHVVSAAVAQLAARQGDVRHLVGNGFRDMTRIAASRPEVWRDICLTNREALLGGLAELREDLSRFEADLARGDGEALEAFFRAGNEARRKVVDG